MAGHLFGYEAALGHRRPGPCRCAQARAAIEPRSPAAVHGRSDGADAAAHAAPRLRAHRRPLLRRAPRRRATTATSRPAPPCGCRRCCATPSASLPLDAYQIEHGKVGTPAVVIDDLTGALTRAIEELTRPVDAIKHQAKTVTVGISRTDETLLQVPLVAGGARRRRAARLAQLPHAAHAGRHRSRRRRGRWASSATASSGDPPSTATRPMSSSTGAAWPSASQPQRSRPGAVGHQAPASPSSGRCWPARGRRDGRTLIDRPRGEGRRHHGHHAAARAVPRPAAGSSARSVLQGYPAGSRPSATRSPRPSRSSARTSWPRSPWSTC